MPFSFRVSFSPFGLDVCIIMVWAILLVINQTSSLGTKHILHHHRFGLRAASRLHHLHCLGNRGRSGHTAPTLEIQLSHPGPALRWGGVAGTAGSSLEKRQGCARAAPPARLHYLLHAERCLSAPVKRSHHARDTFT